MKKILLLLFVCIFSVNAFTQGKKWNPIVFTEFSLGPFISLKEGAGSIFLELSLNYQKNKYLFTLRKKHLANVPLLAWDNPALIEYTKEYSFLVGKRFFNGDLSYSFSGGISHSKTKKYNSVTHVFEKTSFIGIPLEINIRSIKGKIRRTKFLGLFPFGKPTPFGFSPGIKLLGSISKQPYIGIGFMLGFGHYKNYN